MSKRMILAAALVAIGAAVLCGTGCESVQETVDAVKAADWSGWWSDNGDAVTDAAKDAKAAIDTAKEAK